MLGIYMDWALRVLALTGDYPKESAGSETKANFELGSVQLLSLFRKCG